MDCLKCYHCSKQLEPPTCFDYYDNIYCLTCMKRNHELLHCEVCGQFVTDIQESIQLKEYQNPIHRECFICYECCIPLDPDDYETVTGKPVCSDCQVIANSHRCYVCDKGIVGRICIDRHRFFHVEHFQCIKCEKPLHGKNYITHHNRYYCPEHGAMYIKRCSFCKQKLLPETQDRIRWKNKYYHKFCLCCRVCGCGLDVDAKSLYGRPYCDQCYQQRVELGECTPEGRAIQGKHKHVVEDLEKRREEYSELFQRPFVLPRYTALEKSDRPSDETDKEQSDHTLTLTKIERSDKSQTITENDQSD